MGTGGNGVVTEPTVTITNDRVSIFAGVTNGTLAGVSQAVAGQVFGAWGATIALGQTAPASWQQIGVGMNSLASALTGRMTTTGKVIVLYGNNTVGQVAGVGQIAAGSSFGGWGIYG
ncbi:hypothetical protein ATY41_02615 [Leifsonia xyli subsp. xyli]|uniref:Uncharacterized protein n=2 Tax=Leifsonia xyli TaxID=1575 RepID=A0A1E2SJQ3_LEIXY|nr:hypothetical protein ATY41_02615 [Leifsonia xyli subsp. xyli]